VEIERWDGGCDSLKYLFCKCEGNVQYVGMREWAVLIAVYDAVYILDSFSEVPASFSGVYILKLELKWIHLV
jgi:hypothetical protein